MQNFPGLFAMEAVLDLFASLGAENVFERVTTVTSWTRDTLRRLGGDLTHDRHPHFDSPIVTARFSGSDVSEMAGSLKAAGIAVAARHGNLRVSPHFFNGRQDIAALGEAVRSYLARA